MLIALEALGCLLLAVVMAGRLRTYAHRIPPAEGDRELAAELDRLVRRGTRRLAVAVVDLDAGSRTAFIDADETTAFEVGSVTKAFTGMLLAEAIRRGEVTLDSSVGGLLTETAGSPLGSVSLRELCTHTSGLPRLPRSRGTVARAAWSAVSGADPYRDPRTAAVLQLAKRERLIDRGSARYSNLGGAVLGHALAAAADRDFASLLAERICTPIGMTATRIATSADEVERGWTPAGRRSRPWVLGGYGPAGGAVSTIADMIRLVVALLDGSAPGLASLDAIGRFQPDQPERAAGMCWVIDTVADRMMVWHNGQTGGYSAFVALYPQSRRAVVVLADVARAAEQQRLALALIGWLATCRPGPSDQRPPAEI